MPAEALIFAHRPAYFEAFSLAHAGRNRLFRGAKLGISLLNESAQQDESAFDPLRKRKHSAFSRLEPTQKSAGKAEIPVSVFDFDQTRGLQIVFFHDPSAEPDGRLLADDVILRRHPASEKRIFRMDPVFHRRQRKAVLIGTDDVCAPNQKIVRPCFPVSFVIAAGEDQGCHTASQ